MALHSHPTLREGGQGFGSPLLTSTDQSYMQGLQRGNVTLDERTFFSGQQCQERDLAESWKLPNPRGPGE